MFGGFFNRMYYGNPRKPDLKREDITSAGRFKLFFDVLGVRFWKLMQLNMLYVLACVPIITIGPATAGFTYVLRNYARDEHAWVLDDFKTAAFRNFKESFLVMLINAIAFIIIYINIRFYTQMAVESTVFFVLRYVVLGMALVFIMMNIYIFPMLVTYKLGIKDLYKNAFIFTVVKLPHTLVVTLLCGAIIFFSFIIPLTIILLFIFTISFVGLILNSFTNAIFDNYMNPATEKQDNKSGKQL